MIGKLFGILALVTLVGCGGSNAATQPGTPGAEGTLTVAPSAMTTNIASNSSNATALAFKISAAGSDLNCERISVDLGTNNSVYTQMFSAIYLVDALGVRVSSSALNSNTVVVQSNGRLTVTLSNFNYVVLKGNSKEFTIKVDVRAQSAGNSPTVSIPSLGVRCVDGAGIDLYAPSQSIEATLHIVA